MRRLTFDPGKKGGWALLDDRELVEWGRIPLILKKEYDWAEIEGLMHDLAPDQIGIENVNAHAAPSASAVFSLGGCYHCLRLLAGRTGKKVILIQPTMWVKEMVPGKKKGEGKEKHLLNAARLFPVAAKDMSIKANDGVADAILMAEYARKHNL